MNLFLAMMSHETNTFSNIPTDRAQFEAHDLRYAARSSILPRTGTCLGGMIRGERCGAVPCPRCGARLPAGLVTRDIYQHVKDRCSRTSPSRPLDGCSSTCTARWCQKAWTMERLPACGRAPRAVVPSGADRGDARLPRQPHSAMVEGADLLHATRLSARGTWRSARRGRARPRRGHRRAPAPDPAFRPQAAALPPLGSQGTARGPMRRLYDLAEEMEKDPAVISISIFAGFPLADIPEAGLGIYVVTNDDQAKAEVLAERLSRVAWEHRREFTHTARPVPEAVAAALAARQAHRARRHGRQYGRRRGGDGPRSCASCPSARALRPSCLLWTPRGCGLHEGGRGSASRSTSAASRRAPRAPPPSRACRTLSDGRFHLQGPMMRGLPAGSARRRCSTWMT